VRSRHLIQVIRAAETAMLNRVLSELAKLLPADLKKERGVLVHRRRMCDPCLRIKVLPGV